MRSQCVYRKIVRMSDQARTIIDRFGGFPAVAQALGVDVTRVYRWTYPKDRGGTGGTIPARHYPALLEEARRRAIDLTADDLIKTHSAANARAA